MSLFLLAEDYLNKHEFTHGELNPSTFFDLDSSYLLSRLLDSTGRKECYLHREDNTVDTAFVFDP